MTNENERMEHLGEPAGDSSFHLENGGNGGSPRVEQPVGESPAAAEAGQQDASMGFARLLSWFMLLLIMASTLFLTVFIANSARNTLMKKAEDFSMLMSENLSHQIYTRFIVPTLMGREDIALRRPEQYDRLYQVVQPAIHGMHVESLRIYGVDYLVNFSLDRSEQGDSKPADPAISLAMEEQRSTIELVSEISFLQAIFRPFLPEGSYRLRTISPLMTQPEPLGLGAGRYLVGVLEMYQDVTQDMRDIIRFVWLSVAASLVSSIMLFILLQIIIRRAERAITARMKESQRLELELHQHEKLASMGRVVASIAHEVRNPLGIIRSSAELLISRYKDSDKVLSGLLKAIHDEARRLSRTVTDFLDYARPRQPKEDPVSLNKLLDQALVFLNPVLVEHEIEVVPDIEPDLGTLGDKELLYRAFYNVLANAGQAMEENSRPRILTVRGERAGNRVRVSIRDTGAGFDPTQLVHVTDPFYTTKEGGTGLGLAIVNSIVTSHGGSLHLENAPPAEGSKGSGGAVVVIELPAG